MPYLADTNILLRLAVRSDPNHALVRSAVRALTSRGDTGYYTSQNLVEFWNVCTRPTAARGGLGLSLSEADRATRLVERVFELLPDSPATHFEWRRLVVSQGVSGVQVHDARLVAAMRVHGLSTVLTFNTSDFRRYPGIEALHPQSV